MKKKIIISFSVIALLGILSFTSPVSATGFAGHTFSEEYFAVEVDLEADPSNPDVISDLLDASAATGDSDVDEDLQFYMAYMNSSGIEAAYSAFEKLEHDLTFGELLSPAVYSILNAIDPVAINTPVFHINATAPFQQLVQHFTTPWNEDVFVTNNFMSLIAYSANETDRLMDSGDELYLGYTFSAQALIEAVNDTLVANDSSKALDYFDVKPYFESLGDGSFKFGINYTNMFVLWQDIKIAPRGVNIFDSVVPDQFISDDTGGIIFGQDIVAASMLDYLAFEYEFTTQTMTGANNYTLGTVTSHYNIGETNLLITKDNALPTANWNHTPFLSDASYTLDIPDTLVDYDVDGIGPAPGLPTAISITIPDLAFYTGDDAKARIRMQNGFGITVATATTTFGVSVSNPTHADNLDSDDTIDLQMGGNTYFFTDFAGKKSYKLLGLEDLWGIDPNADRPVYIIPFTPSPSWGITGVAKEYFTVEFELAYGFTKFMATQLTPQLFSMPASHLYVESVLYFTFTEFPEWYGGEIIHDPSYSAIAAAAAQAESTSTDLPPGTTTGLNIPGFELISTLLAIPPLYALYRKRRN